MAVNPSSEQQPDEHHRVADDPSDWGWHAEFGKWARVAGWIVVVICILMIFPAHYNGQGTLFLTMVAAGLVLMLLWDRNRRKNAWRE